MSIQRINNLSTRIAANLQTRKLPLKSKQKGASALEYLVLATALIVILGALAGTTGIGQTVQEAFTGLFTDATT